MTKPLVVDVHSHAAPARFVDGVKREGSRYGYAVETSYEGDTRVNVPSEYVITTPDGVQVGARPEKSDELLRQKENDAAGIDVRLQSILPGLMSYGAGERQAEWFVRTINDAHGEEMKAYPDKLSAMATVPLQFPRMAVQELERVGGEYGMRAVQIATNVNGENLDQPQFSPFWEAAESLGLLVWIHPRYQVGKYRMSRYHLANLIGNPLETTIAAASIIFGGVLERYPRLKIVLAHSGGYAPWIRGRWRHGYDARGKESRAHGANKPFDEYFKLLHFDTLIHDKGDCPALRFLIDTVGADHILHGTDYPTDMGNWQQVEMIRGLAGIPDDAKDMILGGNALRLIAADTAGIERDRVPEAASA